ncbi:MAG TPA: hypothetical protein VIV60_03090 [Polyangiaceae bacterium]
MTCSRIQPDGSATRTPRLSEPRIARFGARHIAEGEAAEARAVAVAPVPVPVPVLSLVLVPSLVPVLPE